MQVKPASLIAAGAAVALSAAIAVPALTSAQSTADRTITANEKVQAVTKDDLAPKSRTRVSLGDRLLSRQSMFDSTGKRTGTLYTDCAGVGPTRRLQGRTSVALLCTAAYTFSDGQILTGGRFSLDGKGVLAITGGTGAYTGARGSVRSARPAKGFDSTDVITITG